MTPRPAGRGYAARMAGIDELLQIMARLRDPEQGCPWDLDQDFAAAWGRRLAVHETEVEMVDVGGFLGHLDGAWHGLPFHG